MTQRFIFVALTACLVTASVPAAAQSTGTPAAKTHRPIGYVSVDGGMQVTSTTADSTVTYKSYGEDAVMKTSYETKAAPLASVRAGLRVWRRLTVGVGGSILTKDGSADISAKLPHPFFFQRPREITGTASGIKRDEAAVYAEAGWLAPVSPKLDVCVFAGPAFFRATQEAAVKVQYSESYPFDTAAFVSAESVSKSVSATGFTVGADIAYRFTRTFGVGGLIRFSRATADIEPVSGQPFTIDLGGLQTTVGVRFQF